MGDYIKEKEREGKTVYILDFRAALYMIPLDKYNKDFDMFLLGNLGNENIKHQIRKIEEDDSVMVLIVKEDRLLNWQHPKELTDNVINNWNNVEQIEMFNVYMKEE